MYEIYAELRDKMGLKDFEVCKRIGMSPGTMSDWKNGRYNLKSEKLRKIAEFFGVTVDYLMGNESAPAAVADLSEDEAELLWLFRSFNADGQKRALCALRELSEIPRYTDKSKESSTSGII